MIDQAYESRSFVKRLAFLFCEHPPSEKDLDNMSTRRHRVQKYCNFSKFLISLTCSVFLSSCYILSVVIDFFLLRRKMCRKVSISLSGFQFKVVRSHDSALCFTAQTAIQSIAVLQFSAQIAIQFIAALEVEGELFSSKRFLVTYLQTLWMTLQYSCYLTSGKSV